MSRATLELEHAPTTLARARELADLHAGHDAETYLLVKFPGGGLRIGPLTDSSWAVMPAFTGRNGAIVYRRDGLELMARRIAMVARREVK